MSRSWKRHNLLCSGFTHQSRKVKRKLNFEMKVCSAWVHFLILECLSITAGLDSPAGGVQCRTPGLWRSGCGFSLSGGNSLCYQDRLHLQHAGLCFYCFSCDASYSSLLLVPSAKSYFLFCFTLFAVGERRLHPGLGPVYAAHSQFKYHRDEAEEHWHH